jgi:large subunit ribosomal protein L9
MTITVEGQPVKVETPSAPVRRDRRRRDAEAVSAEANREAEQQPAQSGEGTVVPSAPAADAQEASQEGSPEVTAPAAEDQ